MTLSLLRRACAGLLLCSAFAALAGDRPAAGDALAAGEAIYRHGVLGSGAALQGARQGGRLPVEGSAAACVNCHRRSGLGAREGSYTIPPVSGPYLFHGASAAGADGADLPYVEGQRLDHTPYTEALFARALREGIDSDGRVLSTLMPRFQIADQDVAALSAYLRTLAPAVPPGVTPTLLHFATIVTPDADPVKKQAMLSVMRAYFAEKNTFPFPPAPSMHTSGNSGATRSKSMYMANRHWALHVWELTGAAQTWPAQLDGFLQREPVMAVISGLGGDNWEPVHAFCERARLPCLFPNAEVPVVAEQDFYSLYFSKGVLLEAQLIADRLVERSGEGANAVVQQVYREADSGAAAARALASALAVHGVRSEAHAIPAQADAGATARLIAAAAAQGPLVLWLRAPDLAALAGLPAPAGPVYLSGLMGGLENTPLPPSWRGRAWLAFPVDLPDRRVVRLDYPLGWFAIRHIPVLAPKVQVDTYLACGLLSETLNHLGDNFVREYLVEHIEDGLAHRLLTGYYPTLSLAEGQRFASKGGYLVQLSASDPGKVLADGNWTIP